MVVPRQFEIVILAYLSIRSNSSSDHVSPESTHHGKVFIDVKRHGTKTSLPSHFQY